MEPETTSCHYPREGVTLHCDWTRQILCWFTPLATRFLSESFSGGVKLFPNYKSSCPPPPEMMYTTCKPINCPEFEFVEFWQLSFESCQNYMVWTKKIGIGHINYMHVVYVANPNFLVQTMYITCMLIIVVIVNRGIVIGIKKTQITWLSFAEWTLKTWLPCRVIFTDMRTIKTCFTTIMYNCQMLGKFLLVVGNQRPPLLFIQRWASSEEEPRRKIVLS